MYLLDKIKDKLTYISVENNKKYFYLLINLIKKNFIFKNENLKKTYWNNKDYKNFLKKIQMPFTQIKSGPSRLKKWKINMKLGFFNRLSALSDSKHSINIFVLNFLLFPFFIFINKILILIPFFKNQNSQWKCNIIK